MDPVEIAKLVDLLRSKGVTKATFPNGLSFELGSPVTEKVEPTGTPVMDPTMCRCGHRTYQHRNGECLCSIDCACSPEFGV